MPSKMWKYLAVAAVVACLSGCAGGGGSGPDTAPTVLVTLSGMRRASNVARHKKKDQ